MSAENYQLVVRRGPKPGQTYPLLAPTITVGRDPMSDIVLSDPEVSRYHAQLVETADGYTLHDMGSTNGTYVAGKRIGDEPVLLRPGQDVAFGSGVFLVYEAMEEETNPFDENPFLDDYQPETAVPNYDDSPPAEPLRTAPPPAQPAPLVPPDNVERPGRQKRLITITVAVIVLLCLCCVGFFLFMYYYGGDWILQQLQAQAAIVVPQLLA